MTQLLSLLLTMTVTGSLAALAVMAVRFLLKGRSPRWVLCLLWAVVLIRLLLPVSFSSPISLFRWMPTHSTAAVGESERLSAMDLQWQIPKGGESLPQTQQTPQTPSAAAPQHRPTVSPAVADIPSSVQTTVTEPTVDRFSWDRLLLFVWIGGSGVMVLFFAGSYFLYGRRLRRLRPVAEKEQIRAAEKLLPLRRPVKVCSCRLFDTPVVFGLLRPSIILPRTFDWEDTAVLHILLHERVHIKRWDNLSKLAATAAVCLHWFNPIVWLSFRLWCDDMENACDERVLRILGEQSRTDYARSLLSIAEKSRRTLTATPFLAFGESNLKSRVKSVLQYHRKTLLSVTAAVLAVVLVGCSLVTNPMSAKEDPSNSEAASSSAEGSPAGTEPSDNDPADPQAETIPLTLYLFTPENNDIEQDPVGVYLPLSRAASARMTAEELSALMSDSSLGNQRNWFTVTDLSWEEDTVIVSAEQTADDAAGTGDLSRYQRLCWTNTVATTLLENDLADQVFFTLDGEADDSAYVPAELILPELSPEEIDAMYSTLDYETMRENVMAYGEYSSGPDLSRWDLAGDTVAADLLWNIRQATRWGLPSHDFDGIENAPSDFIIDAALALAPDVCWYGDGNSPNTHMEFDALTYLIGDYECTPAPIVESAAKYLFGENVPIVHQSPGLGTWHEYARCYTPKHFGFGQGFEPYCLDVVETAGSMEVYIAFDHLYRGNKGLKLPGERTEEQYIRYFEQRHVFTFAREGDRWVIDGYRMLDTEQEMIFRNPEAFVYTAVCGGLTFFDWDGIDSLTPDQLYGLFIAAYSPGVNDTELRRSTVEDHFSTYTGVTLSDPTVLRETGLYHADTDYYQIVYPDKVESDIRRSGGYWLDIGLVVAEDGAVYVPMTVFTDAARTQAVSSGRMKLIFTDTGWQPDGFRSDSPAP